MKTIIENPPMDYSEILESLDKNDIQFKLIFAEFWAIVEACNLVKNPDTAPTQLELF